MVNGALVLSPPSLWPSLRGEGSGAQSGAVVPGGEGAVEYLGQDEAAGQAFGGPVEVDIPAPWRNAERMITTLLHVAAGGAIGAMLRYLTNVGAGRLFGPGFPVGTMIVNVAGCFAMGVIVTVLAKKGGNHLAPFLMTGVLGGFTTFSAFSLDALTLWERGQAGAAAIYVLGSVILSLAGIVAGLTLARSLT